MVRWGPGKGGVQIFTNDVSYSNSEDVSHHGKMGSWVRWGYRTTPMMSASATQKMSHHGKMGREDGVQEGGGTGLHQ